MRHTDLCRTLVHSDQAKRMSDEVNMHRCARQEGSIGRWCSFSLQEGESDHTLYDSKQDAVRHAKHNENRMIFIQISPSGLPICDAEVLINVHRKMFDAGIRLIDRDHPHGGREIIPRLAIEDQRAQIASILSGGILPPSNLVFGGEPQ